MKFLKPSSWVLMSILVLGTAVYAAKYFKPGMPNAFQPDVYAVYSWELRIHIAGGIIAALAGLTQFWSGFRNKHKNLHRLSGFTYITAIAIAAPAALILSTVSQGGLVTHIGFGMLAILWAFTTFKALYHITRREITLHKQWMIRSYAHLRLCIVAHVVGCVRRLWRADRSGVSNRLLVMLGAQFTHRRISDCQPA